MSNNVSYWTLFKNGIFGENPVFRLALSLCPAVAVTSGVKNGFLMGVAVLFVMTMTNVTVSLLRNFISPKVRIPSYVFITATWVTVIDQVMAAYPASGVQGNGPLYHAHRRLCHHPFPRGDVREQEQAAAVLR